MNNKKILFIASVASHLYVFHEPYLKWFHDQGYEVHVACNGEFVNSHVYKAWSVGFSRSLLSLSHFKSLFQLKKIINENDFALISCHTPMASVLSRLAAMTARTNGTKLLYTAHGFHFFKGGSLWSWLTYYPVEVALSHLTDAVICINQEDYDLISKKGSSAANYYLIPGIGVSADRFKPLSGEYKKELRENLDIDEHDFVMTYAAEFIERKNHKVIVDAVKMLSYKIDNFTVLFAGKGPLLEQVKDYVISLGLEQHIRFLGFVSDIERYYQAADVAISSSRQEGFGINLVEAMMCGVPAIATVDRGHCTIIDHRINGIIFPQNDAEILADAIVEMYTDNDLRFTLSEAAIKKAAKFEISNSLHAMSNIYLEFLG